MTIVISMITGRGESSVIDDYVYCIIVYCICLTYRGITLMSVPYKMHCDILNWWKRNRFWKQRSCLDHLCSFHKVLNNRRIAKQSTFTCFIDMKKAFDNVNRNCLWPKLEAMSVQVNTLSAIQSMYEDVQCAVGVNGLLTPWFKFPNGVKRGCLMSPTLFSIYIDNLGIEIGDMTVCFMQRI